MKARVLRTNKIVEVEYLGKLGKFAKIFRDIQSGIEYTDDDIVFCYDLNPSVCTDCHQSGRLLALGLRKETADMAWLRGHENPVVLSYPFNDKEGRCTPAWSLHRLIEMMPEEMYGGLLCIFKDSIRYEEVVMDRLEAHFEVIGDNMYENAISCIEWLIKEGYLKKEYLA